MIKAVFFDIDGTLIYGEDARMPESTQIAIKKLKENGVKVFLATGRHLLEMKDLPVSEIRFDGYVTLNGQICLDENKKFLYGQSISTDDINRMEKLSKEKKIPTLMIEKNTMHINFTDHIVEQAQKEVALPMPDVGTYDGERVYQMVVYAPGDILKIVENTLLGCKMTRWNPNAVDIISKEGGKVAGIELFLKKFQISPEEIMVFGDGENDMEMLKFAGIGIAMGNAEDDVKKCADYVTDSVEKHGVQRALEHYGLFRDASVRG